MGSTDFTPIEKSKIFQKVGMLRMMLNKDEDLKKFIAVMIAAYPAYSRKVRYYRKKREKDFSISVENILYSEVRPRPIYGAVLPLGKAANAADIDTRLASDPLFYELAEIAFSLEEKMAKIKW